MFGNRFQAALKTSPLGLVLSMALVAFGGLATAQTPSPSAAPAVAASASIAASIAKLSPSSTKPDWAELTDTQKAALKPLSANWAGMSNGHKNKWIALSKDVDKMTPTEKARLTARMTDWANLSAQQRAQARLNFADAQGQLSTAERQAKWQAYQALSAEEKQKLKADGKQAQAKGAAPAVKPAPDKLAKVPAPLPTPAASGHGYGVAGSGAPGQIGMGGSKRSPKIAIASPGASSSHP